MVILLYYYFLKNSYESVADIVIKINILQHIWTRYERGWVELNH